MDQVDATTARKRVVILGGGPAGAAAALALVRAGGLDHAELALYYRQPPQRRSLGESLPPAAGMLFEQLGIRALLDDSDHWPCPGNLSVWGGGHPVANDYLVDVQGQGFHVDRSQLDTRLLERVQAAGISVHAEHTLTHVRGLSDGFEMSLRSTRGPVSTRADFVVDATGQTAAFARRLPVARNVIDEVISIHAVVRVPSTHRLPDYTMVEAVPEGWWYLSALPGERAYLALTTDKPTLVEKSLGRANDWCQTYAHTRWLHTILPAAAVDRPALRQAPACSSILSRCIGRHWLAVGDAACSTDALMSAGVTRAMYQGMQAGATMVASLAGDTAAAERYQTSVFKQFNRYLGLHHDLYGREQRFAGAGFWQRRHRCMVAPAD